MSSFNLGVDNTPVFDNRVLEPYFDSERKRVLQRVAALTSAHAQAAVADDLAILQGQINSLTVSPLAFSFTATLNQTVFTVSGAATDQGELVLVFRNGLRLRPGFDYTVTFTVDPEVTTITLVTPSANGDVIAGVIYNIAVDSIGAVDAQARSSIAALQSNQNSAIDARIGLASINALGDVVITTPASGHVLRWNGTNWVNQSLAETISLQDLSNVTITAPITGQVLKWNGSAWVNDTDQTGGGSGSTNISIARTATQVTVESDTGLDGAIAGATTLLAGVLTAADKTKLDGIATGATANATDAQLRDRSSHTGTQPLSSLSQSGASIGQVPKWNGSAWVPANDNEGSGGGGGGTVTAVGISSSGSDFSISGSPVTGSGTIDIVLNTVPVAKGGTGANNAASARSNLGLGGLATRNTISNADYAGWPLAVTNGGTGTTTSTGTGSVVLNNSPTFSGTASFGTISASGDITAFSDIRLKTLESPVHVDLEDIAGLTLCDYTFDINGHKSTGVVAQEIRELLPRLVPETEDQGYLSVDYAKAAMAMVISLAREVKQLKEELRKRDANS